MTNAEQRIQALEQEVQLLKAQIQTTLLDIQERLLSSTYPALRLEVGQPAAAKPAPAPESEPEQAAAPYMQFAPEVTTPLDLNSSTPPMRQSTQERAPVFQAPPEDFDQSGMPLLDDFDLPDKQPMVSNDDWTALAKISRWMTAKVIELGPERTRALIQMYAYKQNLKREVLETLLQFVTASEDSLRQSGDESFHGAGDNGRNYTSHNGAAAKSSSVKPRLNLDRQRLSDWMASIG